MSKVKNYIKYMLAIYMAEYFIFNSAFVHNHIIDGHSITHSHFFAGKQHTAGTAELIFLFNTTFSVLANGTELPDCEVCEISTQYVCIAEEPVTGIISATDPRGPPTV